MREIDFSKTLFELVTEYPEVKQIMSELGFNAINQPGMLQTAGRYMTIPKGAQMKKIPLEQIVTAFETSGFIVKGNPRINDKNGLLKSCHFYIKVVLLKKQNDCSMKNLRESMLQKSLLRKKH
mgnify:CR=1 FL=1